MLGSRLVSTFCGAGWRAKIGWTAAAQLGGRHPQRGAESVLNVSLSGSAAAAQLALSGRHVATT